jgi:Mn-containing catalase
MFLHRKELIQPVKVGKPDARFGTFLLEQFGGATGELTAALQYWVQSFHVENAGIRDMLQDIAIEEFGHLEMVGKLIAQHTSKLDQTAVFDAPLFKIKGGGPHFLDSQGSCWTAAYINEGGNVVRDLRADIAAEAGARQTYEALIKACDDDGTKKTLVHLLTREITHANMFMKALASMDKLSDPMFGNVPPDDTVKLVLICRRARTFGVRGIRSPTSNISKTRPRKVVCRHHPSIRTTKHTVPRTSGPSPALRTNSSRPRYRRTRHHQKTCGASTTEPGTP